MPFVVYFASRHAGDATIACTGMRKGCFRDGSCADYQQNKRRTSTGIFRFHAAGGRRKTPLGRKGRQRRSFRKTATVSGTCGRRRTPRRPVPQDGQRCGYGRFLYRETKQGNYRRRRASAIRDAAIPAPAARRFPFCPQPTGDYYLTSDRRHLILD